LKGFIPNQTTMVTSLQMTRQQNAKVLIPAQIVEKKMRRKLRY